VALPALYDPDGGLAFPPTLRNAGSGPRFFVAVQNVSAADVYVWAERNSEGHGTLRFEVTPPDGLAAVVRRVARERPKNVVRAERLAPGVLRVRAVEYDAPAGKAADWEPFPFGPRGSRREVTLRAVFEQPRADRAVKLAVWAGRVASPAYRVVLWNE
jgi:hypothetical protein